ncbi:hypothetical protein TCAL_16756 [Tigriopus californicus]|uniref:LamG-like jellyroll fold domain-containing protein n=1 Tax=Tigriopus californicus TaxID=6832 RepID=A0A553PSB3_TIGCA|nr:hypothetical protein TCAL_16756 [Tigriopus californicus]
MAAFLKLSIAVFALLAVHLTLADHSYPDVGKSPISTDAAESRSDLIAGAVVAGITALAGGLVYTQGILSEPAPVVTPAPPISNFRPAVTTRVVNRIVSAIENQASIELAPDRYSVAQGSEDNEVGNNLLGAVNTPSLDSESDNVVRLGNGDSQSQVQDEGSDDSTESMMETTTGMPDTTTKILKLTMQKASSLYPDMILLPLTQGDSNDPTGTTTMISDTNVQDDANERVGPPTTTTPRSIEDSENDITTIKAPERVKFGSSDQVIDYIKQLTNNIIDEDPSKPNDNGEERSQPDLLPSANTSDSNPEEGDVVTEALGASNIFDRISLNAEAKEEAEEADSNPTTITNPQGKDEDTIPQYSSWTEWTDCSALCTNDFSDTPPTQKRSRTCLNNCQENQFIAEFESQSCNLLLTSPDLEAPLINRMTDALDGEGRPYSPKIIFGPEYDGIEFLNGLSSTFAPAISYPLRTDLSLPSDLTLMAWLYLNETQVREESKSLPLISLAPKGSMKKGLSLVLLGPNRNLALQLDNQETQFFDSKQSVSNNQWTQVGVTHSANTGIVQFYLDGQRVGLPISTSIEGVQFKMSKLMLKPESQLNLAMVNFYQEVLPSELIHTLFHKMKLQERSKLFLTETDNSSTENSSKPKRFSSSEVKLNFLTSKLVNPTSFKRRMRLKSLHVCIGFKDNSSTENNSRPKRFSSSESSHICEIQRQWMSDERRKRRSANFSLNSSQRRGRTNFHSEERSHGQGHMKTEEG